MKGNPGVMMPGGSKNDDTSKADVTSASLMEM